MSDRGLGSDRVRPRKAAVSLRVTLTRVLPQFYVTYDLYIAAFAGAGITLLALVRDLSQ